jgi:transglutaminase-like putative cysteine protease
MICFPSAGRCGASLLVLFVLSLPVYGQPPFKGDWHIESAPGKRVEATLSYLIETPNFDAREWVAYAAMPPVLPGQTGVDAAIRGGGKRVTELSDLKREVLLLRAPVGAGAYKNAKAKSLLVRVDFRATLVARKLVPGKPIAPAEPLTKEVRALCVRATPTSEFKAKEVQAWLDRLSLRRAPAETEMDFAHRVFRQFRKELNYQPENEQRPASQVCQDQRSDCAGICNLYVAALRANDVPARVLPGRLAKSGEGVSASCHVRCEFFAEGVGWVPVEVTSAVTFKKHPDAEYFGVDDGTLLAFHSDTDLVLDTRVSGKQVISHLQWIFYWARGTGSFQDHTRKVKWEVRTIDER